MEERLHHASAYAGSRDWKMSSLTTNFFTHVIFLPRNSGQNETLTIYIEGDGLAWFSRDRISDDPTPLKPVALEMALAQPAGVAVYLARPCQYVDAVKTGCNRRWWTSHRFAPQVIASTDQAIDMLKQHFHAKHIILVGYSGGGAVAALVAARRSDVVKLITAAGNLDIAAWAELHRIHPLSDSENPAAASVHLATIPQLHMVGADDKNIPPAIAESFAARFPAGHRPEIKIIPGFNHQCCWAEKWNSLYPQ